MYAKWNKMIDRKIFMLNENMHSVSKIYAKCKKYILIESAVS